MKSGHAKVATKCSVAARFLSRGDGPAAPEYLAVRNRLVSTAAEAEDRIPLERTRGSDERRLIMGLTIHYRLTSSTRSPIALGEWCETNAQLAPPESTFLCRQRNALHGSDVCQQPLDDLHGGRRRFLHQSYTASEHAGSVAPETIRHDPSAAPGGLLIPTPFPALIFRNGPASGLPASAEIEHVYTPHNERPLYFHDQARQAHWGELIGSTHGNSDAFFVLATTATPFGVSRRESNDQDPAFGWAIRGFLQDAIRQ